MTASPNNSGAINVLREARDLEDFIEAWSQLTPPEKTLNALKARYYMHRSRVWILVFVLAAFLGVLSYEMGIEPGLAITLVLFGSALTLIIIFEIERRNRK